MEKRYLGKTGLEVSVVSMGGIPLQRLNKEEALEIIREGKNQGINFIDTARGYNNSEALIGESLKELGRENFILASKSMKRTRQGILDEFYESLKNLGTDYIDLYQFHNVSKDQDLETILSEDGGLEALKELKKKGLIKAIGISSHSHETLARAIETGEFETIQFPYNPVESQGEYLFEIAKEKEIGVIIMKPLAGGAIRKAELSLRYILQNRNITTVIPGMDSLDQVRENTEVGRKIRPMTPEESLELEDFIGSLDHNFCRRCGYCMPCSVGIDIPSQFLMEGYFSRYDLKDWAKSRYDSMEKNAKDCIGCGQCLDRCPYDLPIIDMLARVKNVMA